MHPSPVAGPIRELIQGLNEGVAIVDDAGTVLEVNRALHRLAGFEPGEVLRGHPLAAVLAEGGEREIAFMSHGEKRHCRVRSVELGEGLRALVCEDISAMRRLESECDRLTAELSDQSLKDPETGLLTERGLMLVLESQVSRSRRYGNPLSLVMLGVYGRDVGRGTMPAIARILRDQLRWADVIARGRGDEFLLLLPETGGEDAARLVEKLQARLAAEFCDREVWSLFGLAEWTRVDDEHRLLHRARQNLQQAQARMSA